MGSVEKPPLIVSVVTTPFSWERSRHKISDKVITELTGFSNSIITVANSKVETQIPKDTTLEAAFGAANDILLKAVAGLIELLTLDGRINLDFGDVSSVLDSRGPALMGYGEATGEHRGKKALQNAITCPLMTDHSIKGAKRLLINIVTDESFLLDEFSEINNLAAAEADPDADIFCGWAVDPALNESGVVRVTVVATGLDNDQAWSPPQEAPRQEDVINLDALAEEPDVGAEAVEPAEPRPVEAASAQRLQARPPAPAAGRPQGQFQIQQQQPRPAVHDPALGVMKPSGPRRRPGASYTQSPDPASRYERNAGVDPVNRDSKFYETPAFFRNKAS
jgi:cell division protein FtsZ